MQRFRLRDYSGSTIVLLARSARAAVRWAEAKLDMTVAAVSTASGSTITPDLWA